MFRKFSLHLLPHGDIFASHFKAFVEGKNGSRRIHSDFDPGQFYKGFVEGESYYCLVVAKKLTGLQFLLIGETESSVSAHVDEDGIVTATISLPQDAYFIEVRTFEACLCSVHLYTCSAFLASCLRTSQLPHDCLSTVRHPATARTTF